jgi:hypothetical protein
LLLLGFQRCHRSSITPTIIPKGSPGGQDADAFVVPFVTNIIIQCGKLVLPPAVALTNCGGYVPSLPKDAIVAQVGWLFRGRLLSDLVFVPPGNSADGMSGPTILN